MGGIPLLAVFDRPKTIALSWGKDGVVTEWNQTFAGVALDLISWPRGPHIQTAADVPSDALVSLGLLYGPIVAGLGFVSAWCYTHYHLTRERHAAILVELEKRHQSAA